MIWAETRYIGCGYSDCNGQLPYMKLVCYYYPGGNYRGRYPYESSTQTSSLPPSTFMIVMCLLLLLSGLNIMVISKYYGCCKCVKGYKYKIIKFEDSEYESNPANVAIKQ